MLIITIFIIGGLYSLGDYITLRVFRVLIILSLFLLLLYLPKAISISRFSSILVRSL